jgi:hypothetical protein
MSVLGAVELMGKLVARRKIQLRITGMAMIKDHRNINMTRDSTSDIKELDKAIKSKYCCSYLHTALPMISTDCCCAQAVQPPPLCDSFFWPEQRHFLPLAYFVFGEAELGKSGSPAVPY